MEAISRSSDPMRRNHSRGCGPCDRGCKCKNCCPKCPTGATGSRGPAGTPGTPGTIGATGATGACFCPEPPAVRVNGPTQAIPTSGVGFTAITFVEPATFDGPGDPMFSNANNTQLVAQEAGRYQVTGTVLWAGAVTPGTFRTLWIRKNGVTFQALQSSSPITTGQGQTVTTLVELAVGEYVELIADQDSGAPLNVLASGEFSPAFMMVRQ